MVKRSPYTYIRLADMGMANGGDFSGTTFVTSLLALALAYPVLRDYRRMRRTVS
jgi:hypothetical protein